MTRHVTYSSGCEPEPLVMGFIAWIRERLRSDVGYLWAVTVSAPPAGGLLGLHHVGRGSGRRHVSTGGTRLEPAMTTTSTLGVRKCACQCFLRSGKRSDRQIPCYGELWEGNKMKKQFLYIDLSVC